MFIFYNMAAAGVRVMKDKPGSDLNPVLFHILWPDSTLAQTGPNSRALPPPPPNMIVNIMWAFYSPDLSVQKTNNSMC